MKHGRKGSHGKRHHKKGSSRFSSSPASAVEEKEPEVDPQEPTIPNPVLPRRGEDREAIGPIVLERYCDSGRPMLTAEEMRQVYANEVSAFSLGCGMKFRWYLGMSPVCPNCGRIYTYTSDDLHKKNFWVKI